jgi:hypothetical protein
MKIICLHGYYKFYEESVGEIAKYNGTYGKDLTAHEDFFTFPNLIDIPEYSIKGKAFSNTIATANFYGKLWELFEANGFAYDFVNELIANINTLGQYFKKYQSTYGFWFSTGLILPGSFSDDGIIIKGYHCTFDFSSLLYKYTEFKF